MTSRPASFLAPLAAALGAAFLACVVLVGTATAALTPPPAPGPAPTPASGGGGRRYVALGDSWAAGSVAAVDPASGPCRRSADAYPALLGPVLAGTAWTSRACASTRGGPNTQFDSLAAETTVVTVTVGSDATGLGALVHGCGAAADVSTCDATAARFDRALAALSPALDAALADIHARAAGARVLVTGFPLVAEGVACPTGAADLDRARRLDDAVTRLDAVLADHSGAAGATFVDLRASFGGHGACAPDPWLAPATTADPLLAGSATAVGHALGVVPVLRPAATAPVLPGSPAPPAPATLPNPTLTPLLPARALDGLVQPLFGD